MGDLSGTGDNMFEGDRIFFDNLGRRFRILPPARLSEPPPNLRISRTSRPWKTYFNMLGTVLPAFFLMYTSLFLILGVVSLDPIMVLSSGLCSLPLILGIFRLHRPKLVHVRLAVPDTGGSGTHALPEGGSLRTPVKTTFSRFLLKDDSVLETPPSKQLWSIFALILLAGISIAVLFYQSSSGWQIAGITLFLLFAIPLWLVGFSLPVLAWWGTSTSQLGLPTRRRDAEAWLMAGMASAFPAFIINSLLAPELIPSSFPAWAGDLSLLAIGAPVCEEISKALAVALFLPAIKGPKQGFQVGFTVGLGFALIENFQYIGLSLIGGPVSVTMTILIRGIGSIPGHAIWTAISGTAIGWMATDKEFKAKLEWRAKNIAISAIDMAESLGLDTDGDGDLSGFDGSRQTLEEAIESATLDSDKSTDSWILNSNPSEKSNPTPPKPIEIAGYSLTYSKNPEIRKLRGLSTPRNVSSALAIAIMGHSFWNGSSFLVGMVTSEEAGMSEGTGTLLMLGWIVILIAVVISVARGLLRGMATLESDF
tara:strand:+ start:8667 stop:10277 length:1611 start_codon:yes stop_codon:yes gene_type:complete